MLAKTIVDSHLLSVSFTMKVRWLNYFLVLVFCNVSLHIFYLYLLLGAHDSLDGTASSLYSFEQVRGILTLGNVPEVM